MIDNFVQDTSNNRTLPATSHIWDKLDYIHCLCSPWKTHILSYQMNSLNNIMEGNLAYVGGGGERHLLHELYN